MTDQPLHPAARAFVADGWDAAWSKGLWAASWSRSIEGLTPAQASWSPAPGRHSIWQIVLHMVFWRETYLRRLATGEQTSDEERDRLNFPEITGVTEASWADARRRLAETHARVARALRDPDPKHDVLAAFLTHDCYHMGQVNYLRAMQGLAPIE
ncbi:MAG TPA: DinB family protein [Phycisphaerales bacterium]|nr:DinB family protein [Phycisphaerales bacterium]